MFIGVSDIKNVWDKMGEAIAEGNTWMAYQSGQFINDRKDLEFFKSQDEAEDFCIANHSDYDNYVGREIRPLYDALGQKIGQDAARDDIDYYFVNGSTEVNATLKVNPDQSLLHNPDGNAFTDALFDHWDKQHLEPSINDLKNNITGIAQGGFNDDVPADHLENNYPIPRNILDGFDVAGLMKKMAGADWYYEYSEYGNVRDRGKRQINDIKSDLLQLSKMENGVMAANYLWDAYVPIYSVNRPDYLSQGLQNNLSTFKNTNMNQDNLEYLKNSLKFMGFDNRVNEDLEKNIRAGVKEFVSKDKAEFYNGNRITESDLHFKRGDQNEKYFWNKYDATLFKPDGSSVSQTFYINLVKRENEETQKPEYRLSGFTLKEATNLLDGRYVHKTFTKENGETYNAWRAVDFTKTDKHGNYEYKQIHENFGYNLDKAIEKVLGHLNSTEKGALIQSLEKGNLQAVKDQNGDRLYLAADPESGKSNKLHMYDQNMKAITTEIQNTSQQKNQSQTQPESPKNSVVQEPTGAQQNLNGDEKGKGQEEKRRNKKDSIADGDDLLEKNGKKKVTGKTKTKAGGGDDDLIPKRRNVSKKGQSL